MRIKKKTNEFWYGGLVSHGIHMPFRNHKVQVSKNMTENQAVPLFISTQGRYLYSEKGFDLQLTDSEIIVSNYSKEIILNEDGTSLKEAFLNAKSRYFPQNGKIPAEEMFSAPQYNTWIELIYNQKQEAIIDYANEIKKNGFPAGVLMIDDMWQEDYGNWEFHPKRFPDPKAMIETLHSMGFVVMLWICPFVSPDSLIFRDLEQRGLLVRDKNGNTAIRKWWNGYSGVFDFTNPEAVTYFHEKCDRLIEKYGVDGFKFDAGDPVYYEYDDICYAPVDPNGQCELWGKIGMKYRLNEYRSCFKCAQQALVQRLCDKRHSWVENGLDTLIPNGIAQGLLGYPFICPDMIGGGSYEDFVPEKLKLDEELIIRYAQCSALFPMMQFSLGVWRVLNDYGADCCRQAVELHRKFSSYILEEAKKSSFSGEPILRHMEYEFPHQGFAGVRDQYMLGSKFLVAPVVKKGERERTVLLPKGRWIDEKGKIYKGGEEILIQVPLSRIPYFEYLGAYDHIL